MENTAVLSSAYFAPIQYYQKLCRYERVMVERYDNYVKQTYRNRCVIATANGVQSLTVPIEKFEGQKCLMKDIRISDHNNWRHIHWNALVSAYGESPFFEYYADDIQPFFTKKWEFLYDFNAEICAKMCELLDINPDIRPTDSYLSSDEIMRNAGYGCADFRDSIRPKHPLPDEDFTPEPYYQVYRDRNGFLPNMSILDLLFNMGNESIFFLFHSCYGK